MVVTMGVTHAMRMVLAMFVDVRYAMHPMVVVLFLVVNVQFIYRADGNGDMCGCKIYNVRNLAPPSTWIIQNYPDDPKVKGEDGLPVEPQLQPS